MFNEKLIEYPTIRPNWRCDQLNFPKIATPSHMLLSCDIDVAPMRHGCLRTLSFNMTSLVRLPFKKYNMMEVITFKVRLLESVQPPPGTHCLDAIPSPML